MTKSQFDDAFFDTLGFIGLAAQDIDAANDHIFGYNTIEGTWSEGRAPLYSTVLPRAESMGRGRLTGMLTSR